MMKHTKKEAKQNLLINEKIRKAKFVTYKSRKLESFKSMNLVKIVSKIKSKFQNLKRIFNSFVGKHSLWFSNVNWIGLRNDSFFWFFEVVIEGTIANWWTHKLFGLKFDVEMIIAHGFLIKQGLDLYWRLRKDGANSKLLTKNN